MNVEDVLRDAEFGLAAIRRQLEVVPLYPTSSIDSDPSPLTSPSGLPALLPFPSPKPHPLHAVKTLVQQTESSLHTHATALLSQQQHEQQQRDHHYQQLDRISSPPPVNPYIGLSGASLSTSSPQLSAELYPLSFSLPQSPPPVPAQHQPFLHRLTQYRHEYYVATPEQQASREYLVRRFGLQEDEPRGRERRRPIEVYGRVGNGRLRKGNGARGPPTQPWTEDSTTQQLPSSTLSKAYLHPANPATRYASYPPPPVSKHHTVPSQLVSLGHLPSNADLVSLVSVTSTATVQRPKREERPRGREEQVSLFEWQNESGEEAKEAISEAASESAPSTVSPDTPAVTATQHDSSSSSSAALRQPASHAHKPSTSTLRFALRSEEEQKTQESPAVQSTASSRHSHHRSTTASAFIPLHDSFGFAAQQPSSATAISVPSTAGTASESAPIRNYDQLLDGFSYHPFFIHHGYVVSDTVEFASFHRTHKRHWTAVTALLGQLQQWAKKEQSKPLLTMYGSAIVALIEKGVTQLTDDDCLECLAPADLTDLKQRRDEAAQQHEEEQQKAAATLIQSTMRMHAEKKRFALLKRRHDAARIIQSKWRRYRALINTRTYVRGQWQQKVEQWKLIQQQWVASYSAFTQRHRVHVHIPSLTLPHYQRAGLFPHLSLYENQHLPRLCELSNPLISIVYLSATALPPDVQTYYIKLLEVGGVKDVHTRLHFLSPELSTFFSSLSHPFPLSSLALYSARLLSSLRVLLRSRPAVIVPADAGFSDWMLAVELGLPLYSVDVEKKARLDGCGGLIRLVSQWNERIRSDREQQYQQQPASANTAASPLSNEVKRSEMVDKDEIVLSVCCRDIYDEDDMYGRLVELMCKYNTVEVWVLRMDDDRDGRGVAYVEVKAMKGLSEALGDEDQSSREERVEAILEDQLMNSIVLLYPSLFPALSSFFTLYFKHGGLIIPHPALPTASAPLTSPCVNMLIEPNGQLTMLSSHDHSLPRPFSPLVSSFPSTHPSSALHTLAASIGKACWKEGVIGHVSVDFLSLPAQLTCLPPVVSIAPQGVLSDGSRDSSVLVPVSLHLHTTTLSSSFSLFHFLMSGRYLWRSRPFAVYKALRAGVKEQRDEEMKQQRADNKKRFHRASTSSIEQLINGPAHEVASASTSTFASRLMSKQLVSSLAAQEEDRHYCVLPLLHLRVLAELPLGSFFAMCRLRQLSFDVGERRGLCFLLYGGMGAGRVGMLGVGGARWEGCKRLEEVLKLMDDESNANALSVYEDANEGHLLMDVLRTVRAVGQNLGVDVAISSTRFPPVANARQSGVVRGTGNR